MVYMARVITAGKLAFDQVDIITPGTINRVAGVNVADLTLNAFWNDSVLSWGFADGLSTANCSISAGTFYFNEMVGANGFYVVRFLPDKVGYWRIVIRHESLGVEQTRDFDAVAALPTHSGLNASFTS